MVRMSVNRVFSHHYRFDQRDCGDVGDMFHKRIGVRELVHGEAGWVGRSERPEQEGQEGRDEWDEREEQGKMEGEAREGMRWGDLSVCTYLKGSNCSNSEPSIMNKE